MGCLAFGVIAARCLVNLGLKHILSQKQPTKNTYLMTQPLLISCLCKQDFHLPDIVLSCAKTGTKPYTREKTFCAWHGLQQMTWLRSLSRAFTLLAWGCDYFCLVQLGANYSSMVTGQQSGWLGKSGSFTLAVWERFFTWDKGVFCQEEGRIYRVP